MKTKLTIYYFVALFLPTIIYGAISCAECLDDVVKIAAGRGQIEGIFEPEGAKPLGVTSNCGFTFPGTFLPIPKQIAMIFIPPWYKARAAKVYQMYTYLNAVNDTGVERYGIPSVYYYGPWNEKDYTMIGITLLEKDIASKQVSKGILENDINGLIIMRDFILSSKYMHRHGVRHNYINPANTMVRKLRSFLIDFHVSSKMNDDSRSIAPEYAPRNGFTNKIKYPIDDWESFLYTICSLLGAPFEWYFRDICSLAAVKADTTDTIEKIKQIKLKTSRTILVEFAKHVFGNGVEGNGIPNYDHFYSMVNDKIEELKWDKTKPALFTWLAGSQEEQEAINDLNENPIPDITKIKHPAKIKFSTMKYPDADVDKFTRMYKDFKSSSSSSSFAQHPISSDKSKKTDDPKKV